jgi:hypothetical protein
VRGKLKLVIEIDGESHEGRFSYDMQRQQFLESMGLTVIMLPQRGRLDGCEPSQRRPFLFVLKPALFLFTIKLFLVRYVVLDLVQLKAYC